MNQGTILAVDDTLASLKLLTDILTAEGYQVHPANSGELALASVAASLPELILLDVRMPGMDGFEVLRQLKAQKQSRDIPVILLTAFTEVENRVEGFKLGAVDFISKPFQHDELLARVHTHLELFRLHARLEHQAAELQRAYEQLQTATSDERKQAEQALRASEARYKRITEELTDYQYTVRIENGRAVETRQSAACITVTGYTAEEFAADPYLWIQMVAPEDRERVREHARKILEGKDVPPIEHRIIRKDWETRWVSDTTILLKDASGRLLSYDGVIKDITERKRAEEALKASAARYRAITETTTYAIVTADIKGNIVGWNAGAENTFGYTKDEALGKPLTMLMPQRYHDRHLDGIGRARAGEHVSGKVAEMHGLTKTGTEFPLSLSLSEWEAADGRFFTGIIRDISEQKLAEENLQRFFNLVPDMACIASTEGHFLKINPMWQAALGYTEQEILTTPFLDFIHPDDRDTTMQQVALQMAGELTVQFSNRYRCKDGSYKWLEWRATPAIDKTLLFALARDTTERKAMENKLLESEARYKRITEGLTDYQYTVRIENGRTVETRQGPACVTVTGYTAEEFAADPYLWIRMVAPEDRERVKGHVQQILAGKDIPPIEHQIIRKDGKTRWVSDTTILCRDASGKLLSYDGVIKDITERKVAEEKIRSLAFYDALTQLPNRRLLNDRLEQAMAASKRSGLYGALMFIDLDNFKPLNDAHGHDVGDLLLIKVAYRITCCVREMDTVARFGGDEFVVMLSELAVDKTESITQAGIVAEKIRATLAEPYVLKIQHEGKAEAVVEHHCTSSIGVVLFINHVASTEDIIKWADIAMYQAKNNGGNLTRFFDEKS